MLYFNPSLSFRARFEALVASASAEVATRTEAFAKDPARFLEWRHDGGLAEQIWLRDAAQAALNWLDAGKDEATTELYLVQHALAALVGRPGIGSDRLLPAYREAAQRLLQALRIDVPQSAAVLLADRDAKLAAEAAERASRVFTRQVAWHANCSFWHIVERNVDGYLLRSLGNGNSNKAVVLAALKALPERAPRNELLNKDGSLDRVL